MMTTGQRSTADRWRQNHAIQPRVRWCHRICTGQFLAFFFVVLIIGCGTQQGGCDPPSVLPNPGDAEASIGPDGGTVEVVDPQSPLFGIKLIIPPGALTGTVTVRLRVADEPLNLPNVPDALRDAMPRFMVDLGGAVLAQHAALWVATPQLNLDGGELPAFLQFDPATEETSPFSATGFDAGGGALKFPVAGSTVVVPLVIKINSSTAKQKLQAARPSLSEFSYDKDAFRHLNYSFIHPGGACYGFASFAKWYWLNRRNGDYCLGRAFSDDDEVSIVDESFSLQTSLSNALLTLFSELARLATDSNYAAGERVWEASVVGALYLEVEVFDRPAILGLWVRGGILSKLYDEGLEAFGRDPTFRSYAHALLVVRVQGDRLIGYDSNSSQLEHIPLSLSGIADYTSGGTQFSGYTYLSNIFNGDELQAIYSRYTSREMPCSQNQAPVANNQAVNVPFNTATPITLTASDPDNGPQPLTYSIVTQPAHGSLSGTLPNVTYTPTSGYNGADSFAFKANDGVEDSYAATVSITVSPNPNQPPVAYNQSVYVPYNTATQITLTANDPDNGPQALTFSIVSQPSRGSLTGTLPNVTYAPTSGYSGSDSFTFKANDGTVDSNIATISMTVDFTWTLKHPTTSPSARYEHKMAYDSIRGVVVLFGGRNGGNLGDTWEWDGNNWTQLNPVTSPSARYGHSMAFDSNRGVIVLFGGNQGALGDTWEWNGASWTQRNPPSSPRGRYGHTMAYDSSRGVTVLFGGWTGFSPVVTFGDTWEWNGTTWTQRSTASSPPARYFHAMAYDILRGMTVLYGGNDFGSSFGDTWEWNGTDWLQRSPTVSPPPSWGTSLVYDTERGVSVNFYATLVVNQTWAWNGAAWILHSPASVPAPRTSYGMAFDSQRRVVMLFGGRQGSGNVGDTWEFGTPP